MPETLALHLRGGDSGAVMAEYAEWLPQTPAPRLFVNAKSVAILTGPQREFCRTFANQREATVPGVHIIQEDSPHEIGAAIAKRYGGVCDLLTVGGSTIRSSVLQS